VLLRDRSAARAASAAAARARSAEDNCVAERRCLEVEPAFVSSTSGITARFSFMRLRCSMEEDTTSWETS